MKTWKKIEETKKRTGDITGLKKRNEEKVQKVSTFNRIKTFLNGSQLPDRMLSAKEYCES